MHTRTMSIDPLNLKTDEEKNLLRILLKANEAIAPISRQVFEANSDYPIIYLNPKQKRKELVTLKLKYTVYQRPSLKHLGQWRYDVIDESQKPLFITGNCQLFRTQDTLKITNDTLISKQAAKAIIKQKPKPRISKVPKVMVNHSSIRDDFIEDLTNEVVLTNQASDKLHMKPAAFIEHANPDGKSSVIKGYITMRELDGRELFEVILNDQDAHPKDQISTQDRLKLTRDLLLELRDIHKRKVIHRDLKMENILYNQERKESSIIDFGHSKDKASENCDRVGTPGYRASEIYNYKLADGKSDLYSLGITISMIWGGGNQESEDDHEEEGRSAMRFYAPNFDDLFGPTHPTYTNFTENEKDTFKQWIIAITKPKRSERLSVKEAILWLDNFIEAYQARLASDKEKASQPSAFALKEKIRYSKEKLRASKETKHASKENDRMSTDETHSSKRKALRNSRPLSFLFHKKRMSTPKPVPASLDYSLGH